MKKTLLSALLLAACAIPAAAENVLVIGRLESVVLKPIGSATCPSLTGTMANPDGSVRVSLSNDCGCQESHVRVERALRGSQDGATLAIANRLGEWCRPTLPMTEQALLIHWDGRVLRSWPLQEKEAGLFFKPRQSDTVAGVKAEALPLDGEGLAPLDALLGQLPR